MSQVLQQPTLVLNKVWQPVDVTPVCDAITMVWNERAKIVDDDYQQHDWESWSQMAPQPGEQFIKATRLSLRVPQVVTLTEYDRLPIATVCFSRRNIFKRDHNTCLYCHRQFRTEDLTIDHVIPKSRGGTSTWENCATACVPCNKRKAARTPEEAKMKLRHKPTRPEWKPLYAIPAMKFESWSKFISEAFWNVQLEP